MNGARIRCLLNLLRAQVHSGGRRVLLSEWISNSSMIPVAVPSFSGASKPWAVTTATIDIGSRRT